MFRHVVRDRALGTFRSIAQYLTVAEVEFGERQVGADKGEELRCGGIEIAFREAYPQDCVASCLADEVLADARAVVDRPRRESPSQQWRRRVEHDHNKIACISVRCVTQ